MNAQTMKRVGSWVAMMFMVLWSSAMAFAGDMANIVVVAQPDCAQNRAALQAALDTAPVEVVLAPGVFCIDRPLVVHSRTIIRGSQQDGQRLSSICQIHPATSIFHLSNVWGVEIAELNLGLNRSITKISNIAASEGLPCSLSPDIAAAEGVSCTLNPWNPDACLWRRGSGIAAYNTRGVRVRGLHITGGTYGIALLDQPLLERPQHGPGAAFSLRTNSKYSSILRVEDDPCSPGRSNVAWTIEDNLIEYARDGLLVYNLSHSVVERNTVRESVRFNGIKIGCGPVRHNRFVANYLARNGVDGRGDGIDVAWAWTITAKPSADGRCLETVEDVPDGHFRDNLFAFNLAWGNGGSGIAMKTKPASFKATDCDGNPFDLPNVPQDIQAFVRNDIVGNILWGNGVGAGDCKPGNCPFSQLELRRLLPLSPEQASGGMRVFRNILAADPGQPANGAFLCKIFNGMEYAGNWHRGSVAVGDQHDIWIEWSNRQKCTMSNVSFLRNFADLTDMHLPPPGNPVYQQLVGTSLPATDTAYQSLVDAIVASHPYHLEDSDGDSCPNAREALAGTDHLDPASVGPCF
ncbi:MAG TPA: hypothetical protein ENJ79_07235 [Gammaproteobacteria bacterium]|nr:hypothetical protein [Gammaproteobacteria bacterium]